MTVKNLTQISLFAALLCVVAPFSLTVGAVPFSLATLMIYLIGGLSDCKCALFSVLIYILTGLCGLPVFSGFESGFGKILSPTGGFILGYLPCVFVISYFKSRIKKAALLPLFMALGTAICYTFGLIWFIFVTKIGILSSFALCVAPFLPFDALKIAFASWFLKRFDLTLK